MFQKNIKQNKFVKNAIRQPGFNALQVKLSPLGISLNLKVQKQSQSFHTYHDIYWIMKIYFLKLTTAQRQWRECPEHTFYLSIFYLSTCGGGKSTPKVRTFFVQKNVSRCYLKAIFGIWDMVCLAFSTSKPLTILGNASIFSR